MKILLISILIAFPLSIFAQDNQWVTNGPYNARIQDIEIDKTDDQHIIIGTVENGLYQTFNGGQDWTHIDSDIVFHTIREVEIHPFAPDTIFVSTVQGAYRSWDGGVTWDRIQFPTGWQWEIRALLIHPIYPNVIFAAGPFPTSISYISYDGGRTWSESNLTGHITPHEFIADPVDDSTIYALSYSALSRLSIWKTTDLDGSWVNIHNNLDTITAIYDLAISPVNNQILYACGQDLNQVHGKCVYKSIEGGGHWTDITPDSLSIPWINGIHVSEADPNTVYIATYENGVMKSTDGGLTWNEINIGLVGRFTEDVVENNGILYLGTYYNGIYRSLDNGDSWEKISRNIPNTNCNDFTVNNLNPAKQFICTNYSLYRTIDYGQSWELIDVLYPDYNRHLDGVSYHPDSLNTIFAVVYDWYNPQGLGIIRSFDNGLNWEMFNNGFPPNIFSARIFISANSLSTRLLVPSTYGLYISDDYGEDWYHNPDYPGDYTKVGDVSKVDSDHIYIGNYRSSDRGDTWEQVSLPPPYSSVHDIKCHPDDVNTIFITIFGGGVFKSYDRGDTWTDITGNLPIDPDFGNISGLAVSPHNPENLFVTSHHMGVFQTQNGGDNWEEFNEGLNTLISTAYTVVDPIDTSRVYLATGEHSVWSIHRTPVSIEEEKPIAQELNLSSNHPNPFNAVTTISFSLPEPSDVIIEVYDIQGRNVEVINEGRQPAGKHSLTWEAGNISSGVYFYRIQAGDYTATKKMLLLK